jgi:hypothetical protein
VLRLYSTYSQCFIFGFQLKSILAASTRLYILPVRVMFFLGIH